MVPSTSIGYSASDGKDLRMLKSHHRNVVGFVQVDLYMKDICLELIPKPSPCPSVCVCSFCIYEHHHTFINLFIFIFD